MILILLNSYSYITSLLYLKNDTINKTIFIKVITMTKLNKHYPINNQTGTNLIL